MLGRSQKLEDIYILEEKPIDRADISVNIDALSESKRLDHLFNIMKDEEESSFDNCFTISYLNINRIKPHLADLKCDDMFMRSDVIALGETWLQPDEIVSFEDKGFSGAQINIGNGKGIMAFAKHKYEKKMTTYFCNSFCAIFMETEKLDIVF